MSFEHDEAELEKAVLGLLGELGWETANAYGEVFPDSFLGRDSATEVVLRDRLDTVVATLNPDVGDKARADAIEQLTRLRPPAAGVRNNRDVWNLLRDGAKVEVRDEAGNRQTVTVRFIDWDDPEANDWLAVRQFIVLGDLYSTRSDVVGFVNGIPLVFMELKAPQVECKRAYDDNLVHYRASIPQLFWFNGITILSNGEETKVGSYSADWDYFGDWKRISDEEETPSTSIETTVRGVCDKARLLDLVENFILFQEAKGGLIKITAHNHQFLGVNNALASLQAIQHNHGRLGVFWHTQGSGKSFSMIFLGQKALRKVYGGYTFVIVTDRTDLDDQIYKNFVSTGAVTEPQGREDGPQATSGDHLKQLLTTDHRYVFTLIHKFRTETGETYPMLSERDDIVVIADEAHRTQYDTLALNMRNALPNAAFLAFTGTPLIAEEERTREVFGDYISIYNFRQSIEDRATVPLYYENRSPEVQLINDRFNQDMEQILEEAELDEDQERRLAREFAREYYLITDDDRLDTVATDLVDHFINRGHQGKAMVISIDKATAIKMYDRVQAEWQRRMAQLEDEANHAEGEHREALRHKLAQMQGTDMAVVVSASQNEITEMADKGADIVPHRKRMVEEDLDTKFKDPDDPLRIVFVCAMWLTGFDAPATSTIYLDKPMKNHTLMQTIARANRVFQDKEAGEIIDYIGVFRRLQEALAIYGSGSGGGVEPGDLPVEAKETQAEALRELLAKIEAFAQSHDVDLPAGLGVSGFDWVAWLKDAADKLLATEDTRRGFLAQADLAARVWKSLKPHPAATDAQPLMSVIVRLAQRIRSEIGKPDISGVMSDVERLLQESVGATPYVIPEEGPGRVDLTDINFETLTELFATGNKNTAAARLQAALEAKVNQMVRINPTRIDYAEKLQELIDRFNSGAASIETLFAELKELARSLDQEAERHVREQLTEEELAIFDLLTKPDPTLTATEEAQVKRVVHQLLERLKRELLVLDWKNRQATRAAIRYAIETDLDQGLPDAYDRAIYVRKCAAVYDHVFASYQGDGTSVYDEVA